MMQQKITGTITIDAWLRGKGNSKADDGHVIVDVRRQDEFGGIIG
ncbi:hypothetical protein [Butyrivibrio sp. Su6]|nr:hypothetical protein [Butyrivibrio sp. Su6]